ncbi:hypothetical protein EMIHUDRAFT_198020 [Emiliania huxleyi CCMP1516]|uniref:HIG1 domain-containing protein n=2 Tax=Emiliania huxleyi TaxID=2903 RepID=A0A0D3IE51_EMIH1|nr:hypothetical protein EMIHUDRAFT_198020 [Emiliania huxleyi CCMP1516]EOD09536.1 hypothetical protein EMIHUDRAFT_198020 [Emiliania huxleyi CCMP1516]|eukprot:XP_005761965.1 hypothetical protein EMIHUDRAFT_198020 [Emiliania huxleyi CCMP1516]
MSSEPPPLYKPELLEPKKKLTLLQHCYKEPWIPFGCLVTVGALCTGLAGFIQGDQKLMQRMMRMRVVAQGATAASQLSGDKESVKLSGK